MLRYLFLGTALHVFFFVILSFPLSCNQYQLWQLHSSCWRLLRLPLGVFRGRGAGSFVMGLQSLTNCGRCPTFTCFFAMRIATQSFLPVPIMTRQCMRPFSSCWNVRMSIRHFVDSFRIWRIFPVRPCHRLPMLAALGKRGQAFG